MNPIAPQTLFLPVRGIDGSDMHNKYVQYDKDKSAFEVNLSIIDWEEQAFKNKDNKTDDPQNISVICHWTDTRPESQLLLHIYRKDLDKYQAMQAAEKAKYVWKPFSERQTWDAPELNVLRLQALPSRRS